MLYPSSPSPRKIIHHGQERWYLICSGACRKEETPSRQDGKPRIGEQAGREATGPGQTSVRHSLITGKNLHRQPTSNTPPASLGSQTKRGKATTGAWLVREQFCGVVKHLGTHIAAPWIQVSNSYPTSQAPAFLCPPQAVGRYKADVGGGRHSACRPLTLLYPRKIHKGRRKKSPFRDRGQKPPTNATLPAKKKNPPPKPKAANTSNEYYLRHYRLHDKHAQENVQWELTLYIESVSSAL